MNKRVVAITKVHCDHGLKIAPSIARDLSLRGHPGSSLARHNELRLGSTAANSLTRYFREAEANLLILFIKPSFNLFVHGNLGLTNPPRAPPLFPVPCLLQIITLPRRTINPWHLSQPLLWEQVPALHPQREKTGGCRGFHPQTQKTEGAGAFRPLKTPMQKTSESQNTVQEPQKAPRKRP
jgi:hypothetical protein